MIQIQNSKPTATEHFYQLAQSQDNKNFRFYVALTAVNVLVIVAWDLDIVCYLFIGAWNFFHS